VRGLSRVAVYENRIGGIAGQGIRHFRQISAICPIIVSGFSLIGHPLMCNNRFKMQEMRKAGSIGRNIRRVIGQVAIKGCLKVVISATIVSFKGGRCYSTEVVWQS
jgi:hypothetical protein